MFGDRVVLRKQTSHHYGEVGNEGNPLFRLQLFLSF